MLSITLGNTGLQVTQLAFGALPMGPLQKNLSLMEQAEVVALALRKGVNFVDTAQAYQTYEPIRKAMEETGVRPVLVTKSTAKTYGDMELSIKDALEKLKVDYIDIFHLHAARDDEGVFEERKDALQCLLDYKAKGIIKFIGIATHHVEVVKIASDMDCIDVIFPLYNKWGLGIQGGTKEEMLEAINGSIIKGKGVYIMKGLGGGVFLEKYTEAIDHIRESFNVPIALGMISKAELEHNYKYFTGAINTGPSLTEFKKGFEIVKVLCIGCGKCIATCPNHAIFMEGEQAKIEKTKCLMCGYCTPGCPKFAIRIL